MAIVRDQLSLGTTDGGAGSSSSVAVTLTADVQPGESVTFDVGYDGTATTVTGSGGSGSFETLHSALAGTLALHLLRGYFPSGASSGTVITFTLGAARTALAAAAGPSFTGVPATGALDSIASVTGSTFAHSTGNVSVGAGGAVIGAAVSWSALGGPNTPTGPSVDGPDFTAAGADKSLVVAYRIESGPGSVPVAGTWAGSNVGGTTIDVAASLIAAPDVPTLPRYGPAFLSGPYAPPGYFESLILNPAVTDTPVQAASGSSSVSAGGGAISAGTKAAVTVASVTAGARATATSTKQALAASTVRAAARVTGLGAKATAAASTARAGARTTATSLKGTLSALQVSAAARVTSTGLKGKLAAAAVSAGARVIDAGLKAVAAIASRVTGGPRVNSAGTSTTIDNRNGTSRVSGGSRVTGSGLKQATTVARVSAGARINSTGRKAAVTVSAVSTGGAVRSVTVKATVSVSRVSAGAFVRTMAVSSLSAIVFEPIPSGSRRAPASGSQAGPRTGHPERSAAGHQSGSGTGTATQPLGGAGRKRGVVI